MNVNRIKGAIATLLFVGLTACSSPQSPSVTTTAGGCVTTTQETNTTVTDLIERTTVTQGESTTATERGDRTTTVAEKTTLLSTTASTTADTTATSAQITTTAVTTMTTNKTTTTVQTAVTTTTSSVAPVTTTTAVSAETSLLMDDPRVVYSGRAVATPYMATMSWSGSGFTLAVRGGTVKANLAGPERSMDEAVWVAVYVNGKRTRKIMLGEGLNEWYTLASDLPNDSVTTVQVVKLSEASWGAATLQGLTVTGEVETPVLPSRKILCIGDSITCGFGVLGRRTDPFSTKTQDVTLTYGWLLADAFNAQRHVISVSGYGVATANTGSTTDGLLPNVYGQTALDNTQPWDHGSYQPDLILVNLGTNDFYGGTDADTLTQGVKTFVAALRAAHPEATIVWVYGLMRDEFLSDIEQTIEQLAAADNRLYFLPAAIATGEQEIGSADHPSDDAHARLAQTLQPQLADVMNW